MKHIANTRFGTVEYHPDKVIFFVDGLIGFEDLHEFIVLPQKKEGPLFWLQSIENPEIAFVLTNPADFFPDYRIAPDKNDRIKLHLSETDGYLLLSVVTVRPDRSITLNLAAPVLMNPDKRFALQAVLEKGGFSTKTPLPQTVAANG